MSIRISKGQIAFNFFNIALLTFITLLTVYPMLYVVFASVSDPARLMSHNGILLRPLGFAVGAYHLVFRYPMIVKGYLNTLIIVVTGVCINILFTAIGAYFLSRKNVYWEKAVMFFIVFTMFFNGGLIPFYLVVKAIGLNDSFWALTLPGAINTFNLIILRTSFMGIPESLEESARLDGANHLVILFRIIIPVSKAAMAVMVLYYMVGHWNAWFNAMIFLKTRTLFPLQLILREILIQSDMTNMTVGVSEANTDQISWSVKYAVIVVATVPILCVYPFLQKYFVKGVLIGSIKG